MRNPLCVYCQRREEERDDAWTELSREKRRRMEAEDQLKTATYDRDQLALALAATSRAKQALEQRLEELRALDEALTKALQMAHTNAGLP